MKKSAIAVRAARLARRYRVDDGARFALRSVDPADTNGMTDRDEAKQLLDETKRVMAELQDKLYAQDQRALLLIFQAMDAAGKDGTIKHVMSGINPTGCHVVSFKAPSDEELGHDYLWRCARNLPERGRIGIFNRSYYEEVLTVRVHPDLLAAQHLPPELRHDKQLWRHRLEDIANFERYLVRNGVVIRKFFLHLSPGEQRKRFLARLDEPEKNWKFAPSDVRDRRFFRDYMRCYQDAIRATATEHAPWFVVPADHKWFTRLVVSSAIIDALAELKLEYPSVSPATRRKLAAARRDLLAE